MSYLAVLAASPGNLERVWRRRGNLLIPPQFGFPPFTRFTARLVLHPELLNSSIESAGRIHQASPRALRSPLRFSLSRPRNRSGRMAGHRVARGGADLTVRTVGPSSPSPHPTLADLFSFLARLRRRFYEDALLMQQQQLPPTPTACVHSTRSLYDRTETNLSPAFSFFVLLGRRWRLKLSLRRRPLTKLGLRCS